MGAGVVNAWGTFWGDSWGTSWGPLHEVEEFVTGGRRSRRIASMPGWYVPTYTATPFVYTHEDEDALLLCGAL